MWCLATRDAEYLARREDILALYERPLNPAEPVVCRDEKPVSLHADVRYSFRLRNHPEPKTPNPRPHASSPEPLAVGEGLEGVSGG